MFYCNFVVSGMSKSFSARNKQSVLGGYIQRNEKKGLRLVFLAYLSTIKQGGNDLNHVIKIVDLNRFKS